MGSEWRGGLALLEYDCDNDRKATFVEKNWFHYSVGGEGRRTSAGVVCAESLYWRCSNKEKVCIEMNDEKEVEKSVSLMYNCPYMIKQGK